MRKFTRRLPRIFISELETQRKSSENRQTLMIAQELKTIIKIGKAGILVNIFSPPPPITHKKKKQTTKNVGIRTNQPTLNDFIDDGFCYEKNKIK